MKIDDMEPATGVTSRGWVLLSFATVVWVLCIPWTGLALYDLILGNPAGVSALESGIATTGAITYGLTGVAGFAFIAQSQHRSTCVALPLYAILLVFAAAVAIGLQVLVGSPQ